MQRTKPFLVISSERDLNRARQSLVREFQDLESAVTILTFVQIKRVHQNLKSIGEILPKFLETDFSDETETFFYKYHRIKKETTNELPADFNIQNSVARTRLSMHDASGNLVAFVKPKRFKLKEDINVFADENQTRFYTTSKPTA
jgi:hypothetical protein